MKEQNITVREFLRNYPKYKKKKLIVSNNGKPEIVVIPYKEWEDEYGPPKVKPRLLKELIEKYSLPGGDPYASQYIDDILYGDYDKIKKKKTTR